MVNLESLRRITHELAMDLKEEEILLNREKTLLTMKTLQVILDNLDEMAAVILANDDVIIINKIFKSTLIELGLDPKIPQNWYKLMGLKEKPIDDPISKAIKTKDIIIEEWVSPISNRIYRVVCIPLIYNGISAVLVLAKRI